MTKTMKNSLMSALVLIVIAVVAVVALSLANKFFPKYVPKLDLDKVQKLQEVAPTGVDNNAALNDRYFIIVDSEIFNLDTFNTANGDKNTKVLAVYRIEKGTNAGGYVTETQSLGYGSQLSVLLTAYGADGKIIGLTALKTDGDYLLENAAQYQKLKDAVIGKASMSSGEITSSTGATANYSVGGIEKNLKLSSQCVAAVKLAGGVQ